MKFVFVGGSGRSGTSAFVHRLQTWPSVGTFLDTELRIYSELDGLWDLYWTLVESYSPQRAHAALQRFETLARDITLTTSDFVGLGAHLETTALQTIFGKVREALTLPSGIGRKTDAETFFQVVRELTEDLAATLPFPDTVPAHERCFVEKTPHCLLRFDLLEKTGLNPVYIHVMRDPRLVAASLRGMSWGPQDLDACCDWVSAYIVEMSGVFARARARGRPIHSFFIESLAANGPAYAGYVARLLGRAEDPAVFDTLDLPTLTRAASRLAEADLLLLNSRLGELAASMGYDALNFGERRADLTDRVHEPDGLDGAGWL